MREFALTLFVASTLAAQSSAPVAGRWNLGVQRLAPDLTGNVLIIDGSTTSTFDLQKDLALGKDSTVLGGYASYEGPRFLLQVATGGQDYKGRNILTRAVTVNGTTYNAGTDLRSTFKVSTADLTWVIKLFRWDQAYIGLDLGANLWKLEVDATGVTTAVGNPMPITQSAHDDLNAPIPQIGASVGAHLLDGHLDLRGSYHLLKKGDASYHHTTLEARAYVLRWLGVRVFHEAETLDVPKDSLSSDFALNLDRSGTGFGVVFRF